MIPAPIPPSEAERLVAQSALRLTEECLQSSLDATRELRKLTGFAATPVIAITANALAGERERCLEAGMTGYLAKPFGSEQLRSTIIDALHEDRRPALNSAAMAASREETEELGHGLLPRLVQAFDDESSEALHAIVAGEKSGDLLATARAAHKLKGSASNFGAEGLKTACTELERAAQEGQHEAVSRQVPLLWRETHRVSLALHRYVAEAV